MNRKRKNRRGLKQITIMLAAITTVVWLVLLIVKHFISGVSAVDLFDDIVSNILGILPPIILFNFVYEYLSKDFMADEISEEITQTLMSNPRALDAFDEDVKRNFVRSTISSIVGHDKIDTVYGAIEPYLIYQYNIRNLFEYNIEVEPYKNPVNWDEKLRFDKQKYYLIREGFNCKKTLTTPLNPKNQFKIGFFADPTMLDAELKNSNYIFREKLQIETKDLKTLADLTATEKLDYIDNVMKLYLHINNVHMKAEEVCIDESGISIAFSAEAEIDVQKELEIDVRFSIPQLKKHGEFLVSITEPTYSPKITFRYDEESMKVRTYTFLNDKTASLSDATRVPGMVKIDPTGWVYPIKGVMFIVDDIAEA